MLWVCAGGAVMAALASRVALVTGSGRGMGRAHAQALAVQGADIIVHDVRRREAEETAGPRLHPPGRSDFGGDTRPSRGGS